MRKQCLALNNSRLLKKVAPATQQNQAYYRGLLRRFDDSSFSIFLPQRFTFKRVIFLTLFYLSLILQSAAPCRFLRCCFAILRKNLGEVITMSLSPREMARIERRTEIILQGAIVGAVVILLGWLAHLGAESVTPDFGVTNDRSYTVALISPDMG